MNKQELAKSIKEDIDKYCKEIYKSGHREHLGISVIGELCSRKLFYLFRWCKKENFSGRMLRLFNVGHNAEDRFIDYLKGIGFEILERQFTISTLDGHYGGSCDGIAKKDNETFLLEFKTSGTGAAFNNIENKSLLEAKPKYWAQICGYGYHLQIKHVLFLIENKNDSSIIIKIEEIDWNYGKQLENKAKDIINSNIPPPRISEQPSYWECKYCFAYEICHHGVVSEKNCRSCKFSLPVENAQWKCLKFDAIIPTDFIKTGCNKWTDIAYD